MGNLDHNLRSLDWLSLSGNNALYLNLVHDELDHPM